MATWGRTGMDEAGRQAARTVLGDKEARVQNAADAARATPLVAAAQAKFDATREALIDAEDAYAATPTSISAEGERLRQANVDASRAHTRAIRELEAVRYLANPLTPQEADATRRTEARALVTAKETRVAERVAQAEAARVAQEAATAARVLSEQRRAQALLPDAKEESRRLHSSAVTADAEHYEAERTGNPAQIAAARQWRTRADAAVQEADTRLRQIANVALGRQTTSRAEDVAEVTAKEERGAARRQAEIAAGVSRANALLPKQEAEITRLRQAIVASQGDPARVNDLTQELRDANAVRGNLLRMSRSGGGAYERQEVGEVRGEALRQDDLAVANAKEDRNIARAYAAQQARAAEAARAEAKRVEKARVAAEREATAAQETAQVARLAAAKKAAKAEAARLAAAQAAATPAPAAALQPMRPRTGSGRRAQLLRRL